MSKYIIDLTKKEEEAKRNPCPCALCLSGHASYSCSPPYTDSKSGHILQEITHNDCHEDCKMFRDYTKKYMEINK